MALLALPPTPIASDNIVSARLPHNAPHPLDQTAREGHHVVSRSADKTEGIVPVLAMCLGVLARGVELKRPVLVKEDEKFEQTRRRVAREKDRVAALQCRVHKVWR